MNLIPFPGGTGTRPANGHEHAAHKQFLSDLEESAGQIVEAGARLIELAKCESCQDTKRLVDLGESALLRGADVHRFIEDYEELEEVRVR